MTQLAISFIIPAYNEESSLPGLLKSIDEYTPSTLTHEVILVDNGSKDNTVKVAKDCDAVVLINEHATVGGLRNLGVSRSKGRVLVFLDADMLLTETWCNNISAVYSSLISDPWQITGSRCGLPEPPGWIERYWFGPLLTKKANYINSGHLITSRMLFDKVDGFDAGLETGEDYALAQAAKSVNASIINNPSLAVVHVGYPKTLYQFVRREVWHGRGDCKSISAILNSRVAMMSLMFIALHIVFFMIVLFYPGMVTALAGLFLIGGVCAYFAVRRHNAVSIKSLIIISVLYYLYFVSRAISCIPSLVARQRRRHRNVEGGEKI